MYGLCALSMNKQRFLRVVVALVLLVSAGAAHAQTPEEHRSEIRQALREFLIRQKAEIDAFRDSINREYARFIEQQWEEMQAVRQNRSFTPPPLTFAPRPQEPEPAPTVIPEPEPAPTVIPEPETRPVVPEPEELPDEPSGREAVFFGKSVTLYQEPIRVPRLRSTAHRDVADFWRGLTGKMSDVIEDLGRIKNELDLDDWGAYRLAYELAPYYVGDITENERVVFSVFILSQRGFKCRMGQSGNKLYPLLATVDKLFNVWTIEIPRESTMYYVVTNDRLDHVNVCNADFPSASRKLDITPTRRLPDIGGSRSSITRSWDDYNGSDYSCTINYDPEIVRYLDSYPCIDFKKYAEGPVDSVGMSTLMEQLEAQMENMDTEAKLNHLLHFVQFAFPYKTDGDNYGYEKWNFPDATLVADFCDCDDRAILWCRLVKELVGVETALVHYPGIHLAAAAAIEAAPGQTTVSAQNRTYVLCDPTYMGADAGMEMPPLAGRSRTVIPLF